VGVNGGNATTYTASGAISTNDSLSVVDGATLAMTLADGRSGQTITVKADNVTSSTLTPASFADGTTITFDASGEVAILQFDGSNWQLIYTDATLS
jgi:hypothetical protein